MEWVATFTGIRMNNARPDYFQPTTPIEATLRRVKGNVRRAMILNAMEEDGIDTIPESWLAHELSAILKDTLGAQHPNHLGGEDLPDLLNGEVEIARVKEIL